MFPIDSGALSGVIGFLSLKDRLELSTVNSHFYHSDSWSDHSWPTLNDFRAYRPYWIFLLMAGFTDSEVRLVFDSDLNKKPPDHLIGSARPVKGYMQDGLLHPNPDAEEMLRNSPDVRSYLVVTRRHHETAGRFYWIIH